MVTSMSSRVLLPRGGGSFEDAELSRLMVAVRERENLSVRLLAEIPSHQWAHHPRWRDGPGAWTLLRRRRTPCERESERQKAHLNEL